MLSGFKVDRAVAMLLHLETRVRVLGDGLRRHALRREESFGTKPGGGAAMKGGAPRILGKHDDFEKKTAVCPAMRMRIRDWSGSDRH